VTPVTPVSTGARPHLPAEDLVTDTGHTVVEPH